MRSDSRRTGSREATADPAARVDGDRDLPDAEVALPGSYELVARLGAGSFGTVYEARQLSTGQRVAIKVFQRPPGQSSAELARQAEWFRREMQLSSELSHPNIVRLIDSGETEAGLLYAVFELVPGATLREVLAREGALEVGEGVHLMSQVLDALSSAHALGIVHRDLKPENVIVTKTGARRNSLVLDFGLGGFVCGEGARFESDPDVPAGTFVGTPAYAAPEQLRGEPASTRSDLYSWGLVFIECLTGEPAMGRGSPAEILHRQLDARPVPIPEIVRGSPLGKLLEVVTAKRVLERDVTAEGLLRALDRLDRATPRHAAAQPAAPGDEVAGERRQVTIVACRLAVSTVEETVDVEEVDQVLHALHATFGEIAARAGGQFASALADRVVLLFGYSRAREDAARRAVRATLELREAVARASERSAARGIRLDVRIGVHTGVIVARELRRGATIDLVGITPQTAAAIEARARGGEILLSSATRALLREGFAIEPAGALETDGSAGTELFRLLDVARPVDEPRTRSETPLVGRTRELETLVSGWRRTVEGEPGSLLLLGEAGIGKSRILRELARDVPRDSWIVCRCTPDDRTSPLRPFVDVLAALPEPLEALLERLGFDVPAVLPLLQALMGGGGFDSKAEPTMTPERRKELTLDAFVRILLRQAEERALVLAVEDLHWADATTVELVTRIVQEIDAARARSAGERPRLFAALTARPEFSPRWSLARGSLLVVSRLEAGEVREMVSAGLSAGGGPSDEVLERIVQRSDGIPLFVEEMTRLVAEAGKGAGGNGAPANGATSEPVIPGTLRDLLTARLDAVAEGARETAQLAAVLGREFRYEILRAVSSRAELDLRDELRELMSAGLVHQRHGSQTESYVFKHALLRDAAYESIVRPARRRLHRRVARTLRERFPELARTRPDALALHYEGAGDVEQAIESWQLAADSALRKAAFVESQQQAERALGLLAGVADSERASRLRLDLLTTLGTVQFNMLGLSAPAVEATFREAQEIAQRLDTELSPKILNGLWGVQLARADREGVEQLLPHMRRLAEKHDDAVAALTGNTAIAVHAFWTADFERGRDYAARARAFYGHDDVRRFVRSYGWDGSMYCYSTEMLCLWHLGHPDQARAVPRDDGQGRAGAEPDVARRGARLRRDAHAPPRRLRGRARRSRPADPARQRAEALPVGRDRHAEPRERAGRDLRRRRGAAGDAAGAHDPPVDRHAAQLRVLPGRARGGAPARRRPRRSERGHRRGPRLLRDVARALLRARAAPPARCRAGAAGRGGGRRGERPLRPRPRAELGRAELRAARSDDARRAAPRGAAPGGGPRRARRGARRLRRGVRHARPATRARGARLALGARGSRRVVQADQCLSLSSG